MNYAKIKQYDITNGPGIRTSLFVSGCNFHCEDCFNQEAQDFNYGHPFTSKTVEQITKYLSDPKVDGLSILGGDPLWQDNHGKIGLIHLCKTAHSFGKTVWLWSGFTWEQIFPIVSTCDFDLTRIYRQELVSHADVFVDGQFDKTKKDLRLRYCGSSNQRVIDVKESLDKGKVVLWKQK